MPTRPRPAAAEVAQIRKHYSVGFSTRDLARKFHLSANAISGIVHYKTYPHVHPDAADFDMDRRPRLATRVLQVTCHGSMASPNAAAERRTMATAGTGMWKRQ